MKKLIFIALIFSAVSANAQYISTVAGIGDSLGYSGDGGLATLAKLNQPRSAAMDKHGNLYIADFGANVIRKVTPAGIISTFAGNGIGTFAGDGGPSTAASIYWPTGIATDRIGNVYISDIYNARIRIVDTAGIIHTFAGGGTSGLGDGGPATAAGVSGPEGITTDTFGNVYFVDGQRVRKVNAAGIMQTIAGYAGAIGYSGDGGPATAAVLNYPNGIAVDATGNVFFADCSNNVIRKIDTAGIITTFAGNGTAGHTGDGGLATAASMHDCQGICIDGVGNIFVADLMNYVVRKINPYNVITTIAGNGTIGYTGDGGLATLAEMNEPIGVCQDNHGNIYICDASNSVMRKVHIVADAMTDSFDVFINSYCNGPFVTVEPASFRTGLKASTNFGDGTIDTSVVTSTWGAVFSHDYPFPGTYSLSSTLYSGSTAIDSVHYSYNYALCNTIPLRFFADFNGDCRMDSTDVYLHQSVLVEVDSNSVAIDTISSLSGYYYTAYGHPGDIYTFKVIAIPAGLFASCPAAGIIVDTLRSLSYFGDTAWFGFRCAGGSTFDLSVDLAPISGRHAGAGTIVVNNNFCEPRNVQVRLTFSPQYYYASGSPTPDSVLGNVAVWNLSGLSATDPAARLITYNLSHAGTWLSPGDTIHYACMVLPSVGDTDTSNNNVVIVDTVTSSWDPNYMVANPAGCIDTGVQTLQYFVSFENTGNDTAFNIYVLDTLPAGLDGTTMNMITSTAKVFNTSRINSAGQTVLKFDFPGINLLDSAHHSACTAAFQYSLKTKPGLLAGTSINNRAGIYFDYNPVVMTNQVYDQLGGCWPTGVAHTIAAAVKIYPNPAHSVLNVEFDAAQYSQCTVSNAMGINLITKQITGSTCVLDISQLPVGLYYISLKGEGGNVVQKWLKL